MSDDDFGALAWRPELEMSRPELDDFLSGRLIARVATISSTGFPLISPLWYLWDGVAIYISVTSNRLVGRNLLRDPRCAVLVDFDERATLGVGTNMAKAVHLLGEAELIPADAGRTVRVEAGACAGLRDAGEVIRLIARRYSTFRADGSVGTTVEDLVDQVVQAGQSGATLARENEGRVLVKLVPRRVRSWDFSKAPFLRQT